MYKKTVVTVLLVLFSGFVILRAQTSGNSVVDVILKGYSAKIFTTNPVTDNEIDQYKHKPETETGDS